MVKDSGLVLDIARSLYKLTRFHTRQFNATD